MKSPRVSTISSNHARAKLAHGRLRNAGFTFIEVIVVIALVAMIAGFGVSMSYSSLAKANAIQERDTLVSLLLSGARARALANINESSHGVRIDTANDRYILFEGTSFPIGTTEPNVPFGDTLKIEANGSPANDYDIIFEQRSGNVITGDGTLVLTSNGKNVTFTINEAGRIDW